MSKKENEVVVPVDVRKQSKEKATVALKALPPVELLKLLVKYERAMGLGR